MDDLTVFSQIRLVNYMALSAITVLYYDHCLTFGEEYRRVWKNIGCRASWFFILNRYFSFFANIAIVCGTFWTFTSLESCSRFHSYRRCVYAISSIIVGVNLLLRLYVAYECNRRVLAFLLTITSVLLAVGLWGNFSNGPRIDVSLVAECHVSFDTSSAIRAVIPWEAIFAFDVVIVCMTMFKAYSLRTAGRLQAGKYDLLGLILWDGTIYFIVMAVANLVNILTYYFLDPLLKNCVTPMTASISVALMSRLMLNLRESAAWEGSRVILDTNHQVTSSIRFNAPSRSDDTDWSRFERDIEMISLPTIEEERDGQ